MQNMENIMHMGVADLRNVLGHRVDAAHFLSEPTVITRSGEPRAVLISYAEWVRREDESGGGLKSLPGRLHRIFYRISPTVTAGTLACLAPPPVWL